MHALKRLNMFHGIVFIVLTYILIIENIFTCVLILKLMTCKSINNRFCVLTSREACLLRIFYAASGDMHAVNRLQLNFVFTYDVFHCFEKK